MHNSGFFFLESEDSGPAAVAFDKKVYTYLLPTIKDFSSYLHTTVQNIYVSEVLFFSKDALKSQLTFTFTLFKS